MGTTVGFIVKINKKSKQSCLYQQDDTGCNTTKFLTLTNQGNRKRKQQWYNWVGEVYSVNLLDLLYQLS